MKHHRIMVCSCNVEQRYSSPGLGERGRRPIARHQCLNNLQAKRLLNRWSVFTLKGDGQRLDFGSTVHTKSFFVMLNETPNLNIRLMFQRISDSY